MGLFAGIAAAVGAAVGSVISSIALTVATMVTATVAALSAVVSGIVTAIASTVTAIAAAVSTVTLNIAQAIGTVSNSILSVLNIPYQYVSTWVDVISSSFKTFLEVIHFETLIKVHEISYLLSDEYRLMMDKIYGRLGEFSDAVGRATGFMETALAIGRKVSLETSSFLGKPYDIGEAIWLKDLSALLKRINETTEVYAVNPSQIWHDLNDIIVRPATDAKARAQQGIFATLDNALDLIKFADEKAQEYRTAVWDVIDKLPSEWQADILPHIDKVWGSIYQWRSTIYMPAIRKLDAIINVLDDTQQKAKNTLRAIAGKLAKGGDILVDIDKLSLSERLEQEGKIAEVSSRVLRQRSDEWFNEAGKHSRTLESIERAVKFKLPAELWFVPEKAGLTAPIGKQAKAKTGWFVGDY